MTYQIINGDCLDVMRGMDADSVDAIVTDPPYGLEFMGKDWDHGCPGVAFWTEALRIAKPGAHLLAFGGSRTYHRMACAVEDAGWEIRDQIMWLYGSGFPKSLDVSKAIDKAAGAEREVVGQGITGAAYTRADRRNADAGFETGQVIRDITAPATDLARRWSGWGTALKPAHEPIVVARKPLIGTVAANVERYGTGALNVDGCRVAWASDADRSRTQNAVWDNSRSEAPRHIQQLANRFANKPRIRGAECSPDTGRWPANVCHDGSPEVVGRFPETTSGNPNGSKRRVSSPFLAHANDMDLSGFGDTGSAARFFYCAKASRSERNVGTDSNHHPTVKPVALMAWLCRLVTQPGGVILDPFAGSGSTGIAAIREGFDFIGIEQDADYCEIARRRLGNAAQDLPLYQEATV